LTFKQIGALNRLMYHTQEKRRVKLSGPILAERNNAWLGIAYYFWQNEVDAIHWGTESKNKTGCYEVYSSEIDCEDVLDTVFNEEHYNFWVVQIEKAASRIIKITGKKATIKEINSYFSEKAKWSELTSGIMFQDLPFSDDLLVKDFNYRKRIQLAVFKLEIILTFAFLYEQKC
jgi:hypothetical protein